ncbi:MAG: TIR domain-containing protein [Limisphaerales bacterium]
MVAERIRRALQKNHDDSVGFDSAVRPGREWFSILHSAIDDAVARGFVLVLLSPASLSSHWCKQETATQETEHALQLAARSRRSNAIPIVVAPFARDALPALGLSM